MNIWHDINPKRITVDEFVAVVEIPKNSKVKYELNKETGILEMDRILYTSTHYPANYGFIPRTYADDGDPLDVLVLCSQTLHPMTLVRCYPIGVIHMIDNGQRDDKIVAVTDVKGDGDSSNDRYILRAANVTSSKKGVTSQLIEKGNTEGIDAVSGATCTSKAILDACENALLSAKRQ